MVKDNSIQKVMVIFLGITLLSSSFTAFSSPVFAAGPGHHMDDFVTAGDGGLNKPYNLLFGPDGNLYVSSYQTNEVLRYNGTTGTFIDAFVTAGDGGLNRPDGLSFGPDGNLYVSSFNSDSVKRYNGITGAFIDVFVITGSGGLDAPYGLSFGPDGNLYVSSFQTHEVLRYNGTTGTFIDAFVTAGSGGLNGPYDTLFAPDGNFYVASGSGDEILRYNSTTGNFIDVFVPAGSGGLDGPDAIVFGPDGNLYVPSEYTHEVLRYNGTTGAFIDVFVAAGDGGLSAPYHSIFGPDGNLYVVSGGTKEVLRYEGPFSGVNSDPIAQNDEITTASDSVITINVLDDNGNGSDWDPDGDLLDVIFVDTSGGTVGLVILNADNSISYDPNGLFDFMIDTDDDTDSFNYTISDGKGGTHKATVTVTINGVDDPPTVDITTPIDNDIFVEGTSITFSGSATDPEDGGISNLITWTSDDDGLIGVGSSITNSSLSVGSHVITASVTDSFGNTDSHSHPISVTSSIPPTTPEIISDKPIYFLGIDTNTVISGNLASDMSLCYSSCSSGDFIPKTKLYRPDGSHQMTTSLDSFLNYTDNTFRYDHSVPPQTGTWTWELTVQDYDTSLVSVIASTTYIVSNGDSPPTVSIITPDDNDNYVEGDSITFSGSATDPEDGGISNLIIWTSDDDGLIGKGSPISNSSLSVGSHVITASVTDSFGNTDSHSHPIMVTAPIAANVTLTVESFDSNGDTINMWTEIYQDNLLILTSFTPFSFSSAIAEEYQIVVHDFEDYIFEKWDDGVTTNKIDVIATNDETFTALYKNDTALPPTTTQPVITTVEQIGTEIKITWEQEKNNLGNLPPTQGLDISIELPVSLADNATFERIIDIQPSVEMGTKTISEHDGLPLVYGTNYCFEIDADWASGLIESEPICLVFEDNVVAVDEEDYGLVEFFVQAENGTANIQIIRDGVQTDYVYDYSKTMDVFNHVDDMIDVNMNRMDSNWIFETTNDSSNVTISVKSEYGVASIHITQDSEESFIEMKSKSSKITDYIRNITGIDFNDLDSYWSFEMGADLSAKQTLICHKSPLYHTHNSELFISNNGVRAHLGHGDKMGHCVTDEEEIEKQETIALIKKQQKEMKHKHELKEKREAFKEIKNEFKDLKKVINADTKDRIKTLVNDIKEVIKELKEDPEYDKEHKKIIKAELKEIKREIVNEIKSDGKISKNKIDSKISKLSKSDNPKYAAKKMGLDYENGKTQIVIELEDKDPAVVDLLSSIGKIDAKDDKHVQLTVNLSDLPKLRSIGGIDNIRSPFPAVQFEEALSEGVYFINADLAQFSGITGKGIKAAVLDLAFTDNSKISDNVVQVKSFRQGIGYTPIQGNENEASHGTAVAEIISDVAPDVQLYLYSMETDIEFSAAVDEAISQQVDIIVMSAGWPNFPTDGTSHITKKIEQAVDTGITFVVPAGNFANKHWEGNFADSNFNNWHEFSNSDEGLTIEVTEERIVQEKPIIAHLMWDVGMNDVADFELVLVNPLGQIVDYSANEQNTKSDNPFEYIHYVPEIDGIYSIGVLFAGDMSSISERPSASLEIFSVNDDLEYPISKSSVSVPADATGAIVVGAVNHLDGKLESFSSQGPTNNGKLAPHVVGPDGVTTLALDGNPFYGTSATAPYVAGLAALIIQTTPDITPQQLLNEIQQNADSSLFSPQNEFDYAFGYGSASAIFLLEETEVFE